MVFDKQWFITHQKRLLQVANSYFGRWIFRLYRLPIIKGYVCKILPNSVAEYVWINNRLNLKEYFYEDNDYAIRLRNLFYPLWMVMHIWDLFADTFVPQLSFGFSTLTVSPDATHVDGMVGQDYGAGTSNSWGTIRGAAGSENDPTSTFTSAVFMLSTNVSNCWRECQWMVLKFDTSSLTSSASISAATLSLFGRNTSDALAITPNLAIVAATVGSADNTLANGDYSTYGTTDFATRLAFGSVAINATNDFALNASGIANISKTGTSKFGAINGNYFVDNIAPTWTSVKTSLINIFTSRETDSGTGAYKPVLTVTYTISTGTTTPNANLLTMGVG